MPIDQPIPPIELVRPRGRRKRQKAFPSRIFFYQLFLVILSIIAFLPTALAQDSSSTSSTISSSSSSTRTTLSSSRTTSRTSTASSSASSSSNVATTKTYSVPNLPTSVTLPSLNKTSPLIQLQLPSTSSSSGTSNVLYLTFSICTLTSNTTLLPTILISNSDPPSFDLGSKSILDQSSGGTGSSISGDRNSAGYNRRNNKNGNTWLISLDRGFGNWTLNSTDTNTDSGIDESTVNILFGLGLQTDGITLEEELDYEGGLVIQMDASVDAPSHVISPSLPFLGDTTSTQALIFSPLLYASTPIEPSYPNYTLPSPQLTFTPFNDLSPESLISGNTSLSNNLTLYVVPTDSSNSPTTNGLDYSTCAISLAVNTTGSLAEKVIVKSEQPEWSSIGNSEGYRHHWTIGGLSENTNYTSWFKDENGVWSGPIWFTTKSESFPCQLLLPTSICPSIAYSAPLPINSTSSSSSNGDLISETSPIQTLPDELTSILTSNLEAFSTTLLSQACGRDLYSHVSTCSDCFNSYRDWLCRLVIPQCGIPSESSSTTSTDQTTTPVPSIIHRTPSSSSNSSYIPPYEYDELLPCLSTCNYVDRRCPVNMGFRCPRRQINANQTYAFIGTSSDHGDGSQEGGVLSNDKWGNRWCNG